MAQLHTSDLDDNIPLFIRDRIPKARIRKVFDVGANVGWVTISFLNSFPDAFVWSFEPVPSIYKNLEAGVSLHADINRAKLCQLALGARDGCARITAMPDVTVNRIIDTSDVPTVDIQIARGDTFCEQHGIDHIDYLKVDAEGHDMQVLIGFGDMLSRGAIDFVQVEAGMADDNTSHINFKCFEGFLKALGYRLLAVKNQASYELPYLTWADVVFIRDAVMATYV